MSIVYYKEIDNKLLRLEAEFYNKEYLELDNKLRIYPTLRSLTSKITCGPFGSNLLDTLYVENGILVVRPFNLKECTIENENHVYISKESLKNNKLKLYPANSLLFSRVGDIKVGVLNQEATISPNIIAVEFSSPNISKFLGIYFQSYYGYKQIDRQLKISVQPTISTGIIEELKIPIFKNIDKILINLFNKSIKYKDYANQVYVLAEQLLLEEIGLKDWKPSDEQTNIKSFKDSFLSTGRLDAEYYQPKYEDYLDLILNYKNGCRVLDQACQIKDFNYTPIEEQEYKYIELSNIGNAGDINGCSIDLGVNLPSRARRQVKKGDVLISSIEGSLSSCALITKEYDSAICSTGFYVVNSELINSETLLVLFKSELLQNLLKQGCSGTILTAINKTEFTNLPIPVIDKPIQQQIADNIQESFKLKRQSERLLQVAKRAVEIAIEQNEDVAIAYINQNSIE